MPTSDLQLGQRAQLISDDTVGIVRYIGSIHVAQGDFIGLELSTPNGKNDGSVQGRRYFQCEPKHGLFVKPNAVRPLAVAPSPPASTTATTAATTTTTGLKRTSRTSMAPPSTSTLKKLSTSRMSMAPPARRQSTTSGPSRLSNTSRQSAGEPSGKITPVSEVQQEEPVQRKPQSPELNRSSINFDVENEELKAKISVLESRRDEREALLSSALAEKEKYAGLVQKLESKLKPLTEELQESRAQAQEYKKSQREAENAQEEHEMMMESLALDRELALEENDKLKNEVEELKFKVDELELQNEIYQEEKTLEHAGSEDEHNPHDIVHLQVENKRMREALLKLRDLTTDEKADLKSQIAQLQEEVVELPETKAKNAELQQQLSKAQEIIDHQKGQLESSEDSETLIMDMQSRLEASTSKVSELAALVETSNESEEINNKIIVSLEDAQRGLQAELEHQRALFQAATERIVGYERVVADQDDTVEKYRKLTSTLQSNLREAQGSHEISQQEKVVAEKRAQNLQDLAKEARKSTERSQLREYEHHMIVLRSELAQKELSIVKAYLPESYKTIESSVQSLLTLRNVSGKIKALNDLLRNKTREPLTTDYDDNKIARPRLISRLGYLDLIIQRFEEYFTTAPLTAFIKLGELKNELLSMDKAIDAWTSSLTKDSPVEINIVEQAGRYIKFLENVAEGHLPQPTTTILELSDYVLDFERQLYRSEHDLISLQTYLHYLKEMFVRHFNIDLENDELDREQYEEHSAALIRMMNTQENILAREVRILKIVQDLKERNMTLDSRVQEQIFLAMRGSAEALNMVYEVTKGFSKLINEEREFDMTILELRPVIGNIPYETLIHQLTDTLRYITTGRELLDNPEYLHEELEESVQYPWISHNIILKNEEVDVQDLTQQLAMTRKDLVEKNTQIAVFKKTIAELEVSIEVWNKRIADLGIKKTKTVELEKALNTSSVKVDTLQEKVQVLEQQLKKASTERQQEIVPTPPTIPSKIPMPVTASANATILKRQVENLESTIRDIHIAKHQQMPIQFEPLKTEKKKRSELAERTAMNMKAALDRLAMEKKENRKIKTKPNTKTTMTRRYMTAEQALDGFRRALQQY